MIGKNHVPNLTGTIFAYKPKGSIFEREKDKSLMLIMRPDTLKK